MRRLTIYFFAALYFLLVAQSAKAEQLNPRSRVKVQPNTQTGAKSGLRSTSSGAAASPTTTGTKTAPVSTRQTKQQPQSQALPARAQPQPQATTTTRTVQENSPNGLPPKRKISSTGEQRSVVTRKIRYKSNVAYGAYAERYWVGVVGGMGTIKTATANAQTIRESGELNKNLMVGLQGDLRFHRHYGLELDGYYGLAGTQTLDYQNGITDAVSLKHWGVLVNAKGEYPFYAGNMHVVPKLGAGYGMVKIDNKVTHTDTGVVDNYDTKESIKGFFGVVGIEFEPVRDLIISADYLKALSASGEVTVSGTPTTLTGVGFSRIRAGLYYRLFPSLVLGGQFNQRKMTASNVPFNNFTGGLTNDESISQILGVAYYEF